MISSTRLALAGATLAACLPAVHAQTVTDVFLNSYSLSDSSNGSPASAFTGITGFADRVPDIDNVTLIGVETTAVSSQNAEVTVFNPTNDTINANIRLFRYLNIGGSFGDWGPGVDETTTVLVPITALAPGETRTVNWSRDLSSPSVHAPDLSVGGAWGDVLNSCVGDGILEYGTTVGLEFRKVSPSSVIVLSATVSISMDASVTLTTSLGSNSGGISFCPNPIFGGSGPATMEAFGTLHAADLDFCVLQTSFVPDGLPALVYVTTEPASLPSAAGTICLGGDRLFRSEPQLGSSTEPLEFRLEPVMGATGMSVYAQTFYRTNQGFRVTGAIELPLQ